MNIVQKLTPKIIKGYLTYAFLFFSLILGYSSFTTRDAGYNYVVQDTLTGSYRVFTETGVHFQWPMFTRVTKYKQVATINFGSEDDAEFTRDANPITITFADTYNGDIPATFRFKMPLDPSQIENMHKEFRSMDNLVDSLLVKNARNVTVVTGTQYTGEEFFQGGLNSFKVKLEDQLRDGLYQTERRKVKVETVDSIGVSSKNNNPSELANTTQLVMKNVVLTDENGRVLRTANPLAQYGISVTQVTVGLPVPEKRLNDLLVTKKELVAKRISAEQKIETAKAEAKAVAQEQEIDKQRAIQIAQKQKELAIIDAQQKVEVERQQAELEKVRMDKQREVAVIEKNKELEIARANRDIQAAAAEAAKFQAEAIKATGLAEAEVEKAKLAAKQSAKDIYMAEMQRDIAQVMYTNLKDFKVDMPTNVVVGGEKGSLPSNLDVLTTFGTLGAMDSLSKNLEKEKAQQ